MSRWQLFMMVFLTIMLGANAWREMRNGNFGLGVAFAAMPIAGWIAVIFGKDALAP